MKKTGITYAEVAAAAAAMVARGEAPTNRAIRAALGSGSPNTIQKHLVDWRESQPKAKNTPPEPSKSLLEALSKELAASALAASKEASERLSEALSENADLAAVGESLEAELEAAQEALAKAKAEAALSASQLAEAKAEAEKLREAERLAATLSVRLEAAQERIDDLSRREREAVEKLEKLGRKPS